MEKKIAVAFRAVIMMFVFAMGMGVNSAFADDKVITKEFADEGIEKAVAAMNEMVAKINELERAEDAVELESIMNSVKFRNVRKKYGKVELTDEYRVRLIDANLALAEALKNYITRAALPYQLQEMLEQQASKEKITEEINKATTLKEALS